MELLIFALVAVTIVVVIAGFAFWKRRRAGPTLIAVDEVDGLEEERS